MYFNFEENHPDTPRLDSSLTVLERVLLTTVLYLLVVILALVVPKTEWYKARLAEQQQALQQRIDEAAQRQRDNARFVFMAPRVEMKPPKPPPVAELSDLDRRASARERARDPKNPLPFARGNSPERIDSDMAAGPRDVKPEPAPAAPAKGESEAAPGAVPLPESPNAANARQPIAERPQTRGSASRGARRSDSQRPEVRRDRRPFTIPRAAHPTRTFRRFSSMRKGWSSARGSAASSRRSAGTGSSRTPR